MYTSDKSKYTGDPYSSFAIYRTTLLMNVVAAKIDTAEAASVIDHTLSGDALKTFVLRYGTTRWERVEDALGILADMYEHESSGERVKDLGFIGSWRQEQIIELTRARLI
jgi:hypothetical protein